MANSGTKCFRWSSGQTSCHLRWSRRPLLQRIYWNSTVWRFREHVQQKATVCGRRFMTIHLVNCDFPVVTLNSQMVCRHIYHRLILKWFLRSSSFFSKNTRMCIWVFQSHWRWGVLGASLLGNQQFRKHLWLREIKINDIPNVLIDEL